MLTFDDLLAARHAIAGKVHLTPVFSSTQLGERLGIRLLLKAECLQKTGSFKPRGVLNRLRLLSEAEKARGLVTMSAGNHAQALAWGARQVGAACTVVMPTSAPLSKVKATQAYGATVIQELTMPQVFATAEALRVDRGLTLIHPFDDPHIMAGQGTLGLEILEQAPEVTKVVVGIGGGGLIGGIALGLKHLRPDVKIYGVEPTGADSMYRSVVAGKAMRIEKVDTIADGLGSPYASELTFRLTRRYVDEVVLVTDEQIAEALGLILTYTKLLVEPAGAAGVAALLCGKIRLERNDVVLAVLSGGNIDSARLKTIL